MTWCQVELLFILGNQYSAKDYNKLKPFEEAKVKQLHKGAKKQGTKEKSEPGSSIVAVTCQEDTPPEDKMMMK